jgi:formylglycine-generating enzyme required for sulfatase activity
MNFINQTDGGYSWNPINQGLPCLTLSDYYWPIRAIAIAPSDPDIIYVGTSDLNPYSSLAPSARGIYKSTNGGSEWTSVGGPYTGKWIFKDYCSISSIVVNPIEPNTAYVGTVGGGIWRTINGGESWENIWDEPVNKETLLDVNAIAISPANPNTIYAAAYNFDPLNAMGLSGILIPNRIIKSEDGGDTWERLRLGILTAAPKIDDIAVDSRNADIVYVITEHYKVYKSTDGGKNWDDASGTGGGDPLPYVFRPWTVGKSGSISMHPDYSNVIYASGEWGFKYVYVSPNSGENWLPLGDLKDMHVKEIVLASNADSRVIYAAAIEGLFKVDLSEPALELVGPVVTPTPEPTNANAQSEIEWHDQEGMQIAMSQNKPTMILFYSDRCPACVKLAEVFADTRVINMSKNFVPIVGSRVLDSLYGIRYVPTIVFTNSQGEEVYRIIGYRDADTLVNEMQYALMLSSMPLSEPFTFTNTIGMDFVLIPAGEFDMGSPPDEEGRYSDEGPVHHVTIENPFYIDKYEVTQEQWRAIMGDNPSWFTGDDNLPVEQVSWDDVQDFISKLNDKEGTTKYRLPSEAEWEYACRAGTRTRYSFGDDESELGDYAWYFSNSDWQTHPVGQKKPNPWGLYDMHGNVWEWVQDCVNVSYDGAPADGSAWVVACTYDGAYRVVRGGCCISSAGSCRSADRYHGDQGYRYTNLGFGFRLVKEV